MSISGRRSRAYRDLHFPSERDAFSPALLNLGPRGTLHLGLSRRPMQRNVQRYGQRGMQRGMQRLCNAELILAAISTP